jgi:hypothetical protein
MSKFLWGACAVSALALAYAGQAGGNPPTGQLEIKGTVTRHCTIVTAGSYQPVFITAAPHDTGGTTTDMTISFQAFANANGTGKAITGAYVLRVDANAPCNYALASSNGALKNLDHAQALRAYYAYAHADGVSGTPVHLNNLSPSPIAVNDFTTGAPPPARNLIYVNVNIPSTSEALVAGNYQDTLTITVAPQ